MFGQVNPKNQGLLLIDSVAVLAIVFFHSLGQCGFSMGFLSTFGLALFSFSAGYKLMRNHNLELQNRVFLKQYMVKRFKRLYKPYIGYTLLCLPFLYIVVWIAKNLLNLNYPGLSFFDNPIEAVWKFIIGENPVAYQLWYLVMLIEVTSFCLLILYIFNIKVLFSMGFIISLSFLFFQDIIGFRIIKYGVIFILGMFFATKIEIPEKVGMPVFMPLLIIGSYSFYIYLFQWPFLIPIPGRILTDILHIHNIYVPIFLTMFTVVASVIICRFMKALGINRLFE